MFTALQVCLCFLMFDVLMAKSIQNVSDIDVKDDSLSKKMELFELSLKNISEAMLQMKAERDEEKKRPMFFVRLSSSTTLQVYSIVKFNEIVIDEANNFNSGDGIFVAPVSGVYMFSWTIQEDTSHYAYTELRVDNVVKGTLNIQLSGSETYNVATRLVFCKVQKGDHVWIQTRGEGNANIFPSTYNSKSSFLGVLMNRL